MASVRAGRDARGAMNDLPIPGQPGSNVPDFDMNTMRPASPTPQPNVPPAPLPPDMTQFAPIPYAQPYHSMNIPPPPDPVDDKINKLMASAPTGPDMGPPRGGVAPPPTLRPGSDQAPPVAAAPPTDNTERNQQLVRGRAGIDPSTADTGGADRDIGGDWKKWAAALGIPLAVAALLFRRKGANPAELEKVLQLGNEAKPALEDFRPRAYADDTIAPATDEARHRVNEAYGHDKEATQAQMDKTQRQMDIDAGTIPPEDYAKGEKPRPGTDGYKQWFKYRQQQSKRPK